MKLFRTVEEFEVRMRSKLIIKCLITLLVLNSCSSDEAGSPSSSLEKDTEAPSAPANLRAENTTLTSTELKWSESADNVGVCTYLIIKNDGNYAANSSTERIIKGLDPDETTRIFKYSGVLN